MARRTRRRSALGFFGPVDAGGPVAVLTGFRGTAEQHETLFQRHQKKANEAVLDGLRTISLGQCAESYENLRRSYYWRGQAEAEGRWRKGLSTQTEDTTFRKRLNRLEDDFLQVCTRISGYRRFG